MLPRHWQTLMPKLNPNPPPKKLKDLKKIKRFKKNLGGGACCLGIGKL